ncbi:MAG TPA: oxygenase MpaB family protein [Candidatus Limnocylindrales bacterium]|nr:oxygenase MpaB family protein [Candidatus Limnocylindrales bacterium]
METTFGPGRMIWTVNRELALLIGAGRALLMQLAHPLVAAGVAAHSRFAEDPLGRLVRTLDPMYAMVFGPPDRTAAAMARLRATHARVAGVLPEAIGAYPAGTRYDAGDPALALWVHGTLIDTGVLVYGRFVAPLAPVERARYYADSRELASMLGIPEALTPPTLVAFERYMAETIASDALAVGPTARDLARLVFRPPAARSLRAIGPIVELVTAGLLPGRLRDMYGYRWSPGRERLVAVAAWLLRRALPALPSRLRVAPPARTAERRHLTLTAS